MDRLARDGRNFSKHFANGTHTRNSMSSLLYSRYFVKPVFPSYKGEAVQRPEDLFRKLDDEAISLPASLSNAGIHTVGISAHQWFLEGTEYALEFDEFHDLPRRVAYPEEQAYPRAEALVDYAIDWIEDTPDEREFFLYLHLMDTHFPHFFEEDARTFFDAEGYEPARFKEGGWPTNRSRPLEGRDREYMDALYDGSLLYADRQLGRLFDYLEARGILDSTLIAITSDHGEELLHRKKRFLHGSWWDPVGHIPMILRYPGKVSPGVSDFITEGVDLHPTITGLLGVDLPPNKTVDGRSLLAEGREAERGFAFAFCGMRSERFKLLGSFGPVLKGSPRRAFLLHDLELDPGEVRNVLEEEPDVAHELLEIFLERMRPGFERYEAAQATRPPRGPFAIEVRDLDTTGTVVTRGIGPSWWKQVEAGSNWRLGKIADRPCFVARGDAGPLQASLPVPDGEYDLSVRLSGRCRVMLERPQREAVEIEGPPFAGEDSAGEPVAVGRITVEGRTLRVGIEPLPGDECVQVTSLVLEPVGQAQAGDGESEARAQALRKLGYGN